MSANTALHLQRKLERTERFIRFIANATTNRWQMYSGWQTRREHLLDEIERHLNMADRKKKVKAKWKGFANIDIPSNDKLLAKDVILDYDSTVDRILELVGLGYKMSLTYNEQNDTYTATLTGVYADSPNAGLSMSGYGKHWMIAAGSVCYKHFEVADGNWSDTDSETDELFG